MGGFPLNWIKLIVVQSMSISVLNSLRMGVFLFIDGSALVCGWVNFPILWPHNPVQTKLKCPSPTREVNRSMILVVLSYSLDKKLLQSHLISVDDQNLSMLTGSGWSNLVMEVI